MRYDYFPRLSEAAKSGATRLNFSQLDPDPIYSATGWDNHAHYGSSSYGSSVFAVELTAYAQYDIYSHSFFDPYLLKLYDSTGKVVAIDSGGAWYGADVIHNFVPQSTGTYYIDASWHRGSYHKYASVSIYEDLDRIDSNRPETAPKHYGTSSIDKIRLPGSVEEYTVKAAPVITTVLTSETKQLYVNVERFLFDDMAIAVDITGNAGKVYRLYEAAFDRKPDASGLGFWIKHIDNGVSLEFIASEFLRSDEFNTIYGIQVENGDFVSALYENALGRAADSAGHDYWTSRLDRGALDRAEVLVHFSESPENKAAIIGDLAGGMTYEVWG